MKWVNSSLLKSVLDGASKSSFSDFYSKRFAGVPATEASLESLPFLTRADLADTPLAQRTFVDSKDIRFVGYTSGTSSSKPLVTLFSDVEDYHFEPSLGTDATRALIIYPPLNKNFSHTFVQQCAQADRPITPVFADFSNLANSAVIAREASCDAIYATPTIASLAHEHIKAQYDPSRIKLLALSSEILTHARREELQGMYPNAKIANLYASSEIGQFILFPCADSIASGTNEFHILEEAVAAVELVDSELVVTYGLNKAMPLIRYRTGDYFEVVRAGCTCGRTSPVLGWSHRLGVDRVRVNGVEFTVDDADRLFASIPQLSHPQYQIHFDAPEKGSTAVPIRIEIEDPVAAIDPKRQAMLVPVVEEYVKTQWAIGGATIKAAVEKGLFTYPRVTFVAELSVKGAKAKRLINHII